MLAREEDPSGKAKEEARRKLRSEILLSMEPPRLRKTALGSLAYPVDVHGGLELKVVLEAARTAFKNDEAAALAKYQDDCTRDRRKPKKDWKTGRTWMDFLPKEVIQYDKESDLKVKADPRYADGLKRIEPAPYETLGGPMGDRQQLKMPFAATVVAKEHVVECIKQDLMRSAEVGRAFPCAPPPRIRAAFNAARGDPQKLEEFIREFAFPGLPA